MNASGPARHGEQGTVEEAARELWAALVMEWNGYDDMPGDLAGSTAERIAHAIERHKARFGTDDAWAVLSGGTAP